MSQWRSRLLLLLVGALVAVMVGAATTTASAAKYTYDVSPIARVREHADAKGITESPQLTALRKGPASPQAAALATATTPLAIRNATEGVTVNLSTAGRSVEEATAINQYASRTNSWLAENGPQTIRPTDGALRAEASAAARAERLAAQRAGTPYSGQAGHVPDTAITGQANPPGGSPQPR